MSTILTILFAILSALFDANLLLSGGHFVNHLPRLLFRALIVLLITYFCTRKKGWLYRFLTFLLNASSFYLVFDYALNLFWGKPILRIGTTAIIDKAWHLLGGPIVQLVFKIVLVVGMFIAVEKCGKENKPKPIEKKDYELYAKCCMIKENVLYL